MVSKTAQEWFNGAWERAKYPVRAAVKSRCSYARGAPGGGCFIGVQLPEEVANSPELIEAGVGTLLDVGVVCVSDAPTFFLERLQRIHDGRDPKIWRTHLEALAADYGLTVPVDEVPDVP